jgi:large subunit ribosomal protein L21e
MVTRTGGFRYKTRHKLQKKARDRGKLPINKILSTYKIGDRVRIIQEPSQHSAMPHPRFKNVVGIVKKIMGTSYMVELKDLRKTKHVISKPVHLRKL